MFRFRYRENILGFIAQEVDRDNSLKVEGLNQIKQILSIRDDEKVIVDVMDWSKEYAFTCTDGKRCSIQHPKFRFP